MQSSTINYYVAVTLDGFIAAPDGSFDRFINDESFNADMFRKLQSEFDAVIMGRTTYEVGVAQGVTNPYPWLESYVVTTSYEESPDPDVTLLRSVADVAKLKESGRHPRIWLCGGGRLAAALLDEGLIDVLQVKRHPVVFGSGIRLFESDSFCGIQLEELGPSQRWESGIEVTKFGWAAP